MLGPNWGKFPSLESMAHSVSGSKIFKAGERKIKNLAAIQPYGNLSFLFLDKRTPKGGIIGLSGPEPAKGGNKLITGLYLRNKT